MRRAIRRRFPLLLKFLFPARKTFGAGSSRRCAGRCASASPGARPSAGTSLTPSRERRLRLGLKPGVTAPQLEEAIHREARGRSSQLDQRLCRRHDLRCRRHGAHAGAGIGGRRNAAAIRYDLSPVRLRASARIAFERRHGGGEGESRIGQGGSSGAAADERQQEPARAAGGCSLFCRGYV